MAFTRCRNCRHYNDVHADTGVCMYFERDPARHCACNSFSPMGDSPEGTDIYMSDDPSESKADDSPAPLGYHVAEIEKGVLGELSKVREELDELFDAEAQEARIMQLCEAADLVGALRAWLRKYYYDVTLEDLVKMADLNERAFRSGRRK